MTSIPFATADLCDAHGTQLQVLAPMFRYFGQKKAFCGPMSTLKVFEDNVMVRAALETPGAGRVLVVDGGGSLRCALVGDNLARLVIENHWAGVVVYGCVRDTAVIDVMPVGLYALAPNPLRSARKGVGEKDCVVSFGGVRFEPGHWLYADADGILVSEKDLRSALP